MFPLCYALRMATKRLPPLKTPLPTPEQAQERYAFLDSVIRRRRPDGIQIDELESALGMYMLAHYFGWKVLYLIHSKRTIRKYESLLGIKLSETFEPFGPDAERTNAYTLSKMVSNFWKAVSGDEKLPPGIDKRAMS